jgi:hypothetical protein
MNRLRLLLVIYTITEQNTKNISHHPSTEGNCCMKELYQVLGWLLRYDMLLRSCTILLGRIMLQE